MFCQNVANAIYQGCFIKAHKGRTRFRNATRLFNSQKQIKPPVHQHKEILLQMYTKWLKSFKSFRRLMKNGKEQLKDVEIRKFASRF